MHKTIVILHGWRVDSTRYEPLKKIFEKKGFTVFAPDMPGNGIEKTPEIAMDIDGYVQFVLDFFKRKKIEKAILICHSFGGRVGAKLAAKYPEKIERLILTGAPLIKQPLPLGKKLVSTAAGFAKKALKKSFGYSFGRKILYLVLGEWDYYKAPENVRETFKNIIAEDISPTLERIKSPSLVVWGQNDNFVPRSIGIKIASLIPNCAYIEVPNGTHKLPYESPEEFSRIVLDFLK